MFLNLRSIQSNFKHPVLLVTTLGLLSACGQVPNLKETEEASAKVLSNQILSALSEVEINNPYSTGIDAMCMLDKEVVVVASGNQLRGLKTADFLTNVTCTSTQNRHEVSIQTKNGSKVTQSQDKDSQLILAREDARLILQYLKITEEENLKTNGKDATCTLAGSQLNITSGQSKSNLTLKPEISAANCISTINSFTVVLETKNGQKLTQKTDKPKEYFPTVVAQNILNAMEDVESRNPNSTGADAFCNYLSLEGKVQISSGAISVEVEAPSPINSVTCASTWKSYSSFASTVEGSAIYLSRDKTQP